MAFSKATKKQAKLKITLNGPAGSGKTFSALVIAQILGGKTALADSEHGRALLYADRFDFDHAELAEFSLDTYVRTINEARAAGYGVLILDSLSHAWSGKGGALEEVDKRGGSNKFGNGWRAVTPKQNELIDTIRAYPGHLITTMRKKMDYVQEQDERGKSTVKKVGLAPVQRDGVEYEFDFIFDLDVGGKISVTKSSYSELDNAVLTRKELPAAIERIKRWLEDGAPAPVGGMAPKPDASTPPPTPLTRLRQWAAESNIPDPVWGAKLRELIAPRTDPKSVKHEDADAVIAALRPAEPPEDIPLPMLAPAPTQRLRVIDVAPGESEQQAEQRATAPQGVGQ